MSAPMLYIMVIAIAVFMTLLTSTDEFSHHISEGPTNGPVVYLKNRHMIKNY